MKTDRDKVYTLEKSENFRWNYRRETTHGTGKDKSKKKINRCLIKESKKLNFNMWALSFFVPVLAKKEKGYAYLINDFSQKKL